MNRPTLADVLQGTNQTGSYTLATVLEGAEAGSQLLLRDGDALWQTQSAGLLQRQLAVLQACTATGFLTLDGQRVFAERFGAVPQLVVCGGGHVAAALVKQAKLLGMPVLAIDDREEFAQQLRAAGADIVLSFRTTLEAMEWEKQCNARQVPGRLIPLPRDISAGCGLAWRMLPEDWQSWQAELDQTRFDKVTPVEQ